MFFVEDSVFGPYSYTRLCFVLYTVRKQQLESHISIFNDWSVVKEWIILEIVLLLQRNDLHLWNLWEIKQNFLGSWGQSNQWKRVIVNKLFSNPKKMIEIEKNYI